MSSVQIPRENQPIDQEMTSSSTLSTLAAGSSILPKLIIPKLNPVCSDITDLAYQGHWCDASDPDEYLRFNKARYTCRNRCGKMPPYGNPRSECACDERCYINGDCCPDMVAICPEIHNVGQRMYSHLGYSTASCLNSHSLIHSKCEAKHFRTTKGVVLESSFTPRHTERPLFSPRTLLQYSKEFNLFRVADPLLKIVFDTYNTFELCRAVESEPRYIPVITKLNCNAEHLVKAKMNVGNLMEWCEVKVVEDMRARFDRACPRQTVLSCQCDKVHTELLHNACVGQNKSISYMRSQMKKNWIETYPNWLKLSTPKSNGKCTLNIIDTFRQASSGLGFHNDGFIVHMKITPVASSYQIHINHSKQGSHCKRQREGAQTVNFFENSDTAKENIVFEVEFTRTLERRMCCISLESILSDCQLLECSHSAMMTSRHPHHQNGGLSCVIPVRVDVLHKDHLLPVQMCTCLRAQSVLFSLGKWSVTRINNDGLCSFRLQSLEQGSDTSLPESWKTEINLNEAVGRHSLLSDSMNDIGFEQHLQKAWIKLNASCPLDKDNPSMEVFFYSEDSYNTNKQKYELVEYSIALITFDGKHHRYISSSPGSQDALVSCGATAFMTLYFLTP